MDKEPQTALQSKNSSAKKGDISGISSEPTTPLNFGAQKDKLPRWAQSIAGSEFKAEARKNSAVNESTASMQQLFEQNLKDMDAEAMRKEDSNLLQVPQKIDLLDGEDEDELQMMAQEDEGSEADERIARLRSS